MRVWTEAVKRAILRHVARTGSAVFTRQAFFAAEEAALREETETVGLTPTQTATREFQYLRDAGLLEFVKPGTYRWLGERPDIETGAPSSGVFFLGTRAGGQMLPERGYGFAADLARTARRTVGQWVVYQGAHGYGAAAVVEEIVPDEGVAGASCALIKPGSYLEFGTTVPLTIDGLPIEQGLRRADGRFDATKAARPVRAIAADELNRILELGLVEDDALLPRIDEDGLTPIGVEEEREPFVAQVDRTTMLSSRKVRDRQFRKRVLDAYGSRCALTGMKWTNGRGRAETEAAHIKSVEAAGPDGISNGIALSGTVHWMFDRGLITLSDAGDIVLSRAINDIESVGRLIYPDRKARFPTNAAQRPDPRYLDRRGVDCQTGCIMATTSTSCAGTFGMRRST